MHRRILVTAFILLACAALARSQSFDLDQNRVHMADLVGPWRFHAGDDAGWANPEFDDSHWSLLMATKPWGAQGYGGYQGIGWYRLRVTVPAHSGALGIYFPYVEENFEVYANGHLIGHAGELPPAGHTIVIAARTYFRIPANLIAPGKPVVLAVRVWHVLVAGVSGGGILYPPRIGDAATIAGWRDMQIRYVTSLLVGTVAEFFCNLLTALAGLGLFLLRPKDRGYLWWGVSQAFWALFITIELLRIYRVEPYFSVSLLMLIAMMLAYYFQFEFYVTFLRQRRDWLYWGGIAVIASDLVLSYVNIRLLNGSLAWIPSALGILIQACFVGVLWRGGRRDRVDAALLLIPNSVMLSVTFIDAIVPALSFPWARWIHQFLQESIQWPFRLSVFDVIGLCETFAVLIILLRSYVKTSADEERLEAEFEAARVVQKVLIPDEVPAIPGFTVETVYRPASQVGGDFFQVMPIEDGGALIVIGDVSGKGMPAAMTVSLLVGTVRTLAHYTQSPGEILAAMNQRMLARSGGGFTTCLAMRLGADGTLTTANAGHLAPYIDGKELEIENGLPLGLDSATSYPELTFHLRPEARLTLLTDGVPEARNAAGELFGFERVTAISAGRAEEVAKAAQAFGQEDDITVLTVAFAL
ncbi:MAG TPA: SpoIIE family protein phosphatase [Terracidiphilus sp.]|nr:SpoIIE family protein phosphatase [Terracidiphilus sp.]